MLRLLLLACALGMASAMFGPGKMVKKYAYGKIIEGCLGESIVKEWKDKVSASTSKCSGEEISLDVSKLTSVENFLGSLRRRTMQRQQMQRPLFASVMPQLFMPVMGGNSIQQPVYRGKRQTAYTAESIEAIRAGVISKLSNLTCVMKDLNFANEDLTPNVEYWRSIYEDMEIDQNLKDDFVEIIDACNDFATCMPVEKAKNPIVQELGRLIAFIKCESAYKCLACMKNDLREHMGEAVESAESTLAEEGLSFGEEGSDDPMDGMFELLVVSDDPFLNMA